MGVQALLNAASEFERRGEFRLAEWTRRAVAVAKLPMFMRSEEDVRDDDERPIESCNNPKLVGGDSISSWHR